jgi:hypothetical protein
MQALLASFEPRRDRTSTDRRFVQKPTRHASSRQFESQPAQARGRYEPTLNARPNPPSGSSVRGTMASARGSGDCGEQRLIPGRRALGLNAETSTASNMRMTRQFVGAEGLNPDFLYVRERARERSVIQQQRGAITMTASLADLANMFTRSNGFYAFKSATAMSLERRTCPKGERVVRPGLWRCQYRPH